MGGLAGIVVGYPADTVKVRLQTQPYVAGTPHLYTGTFHCFLTILKNESVRASVVSMRLPNPSFACRRSTACTKG